MNYTIEQIKTVLGRKGYTFFDGDKPYDLNIIGIRKTRDSIINTFEDTISVIYRDENRNPVQETYAATTKPGTFYLTHPMSAGGTAILAPGQYKWAYALGLHRNQYRALVQVKPVKVFRDDDRDNQVDINPAKISQGIYGINIHRSNPFVPSHSVDKWSAGCQVIQDPADFDRLIALCDCAVKQYGNLFTYTLLNQDDFDL
jgi:hypothetical protein